MKTPDRIYISPSIRTEIAYYSRILIGNPKFNICPRYGNEIEYIRADIHEAEINALKAVLEELYTSVQEIIPGKPDDWRKAKERDTTGLFNLRGVTGAARYRADDMHAVYVQMEDVRVLLEGK